MTTVFSYMRDISDVLAHSNGQVRPLHIISTYRFHRLRSVLF